MSKEQRGRRERRRMSPKVLLLSTGLLSMVVVLHLSLPEMSAFLCSELPRVYGAALLWLTPPYLYFLLNGIIISIAASSRFQKPSAEEDDTEAMAQRGDPVGDGLEEEEVSAQEAGFRLPDIGYGEETGDDDEGELEVVTGIAGDEGGEEEELVMSSSSWTLKTRVSSEVAPLPETEIAHMEKPLVSTRVCGQRGVKASPEGRSLGVAKPKKYETLESTWKTITDGRPLPLAMHVKKSDTWGSDGILAQEEEEATTPPPPAMRKSEALGERRVGIGRLRREPSQGQDELNRRVEGFIRKFNEEMRLQRQESFQHYLHMISRASR